MKNFWAGHGIIAVTLITWVITAQLYYVFPLSQLIEFTPISWVVNLDEKTDIHNAEITAKYICN